MKPEGGGLGKGKGLGWGLGILEGFRVRSWGTVELEYLPALVNEGSSMRASLVSADVYFWEKGNCSKDWEKEERYLGLMLRMGFSLAPK